jgi:hypothetical protein
MEPLAPDRNGPRAMARKPARCLFYLVATTNPIPLKTARNRLFPLKCLIYNNVTDVATFRSYMYPTMEATANNLPPTA